MKFKELLNIYDRAKRIRKRLEIKDGEGTNWSYTFEDNETHKYVLNGVKPPEEIQDDIESTFVWLWSLKDYVKKYSVKNGKSQKWVEDKINADSNLCLCADIANSLKHGGLNRKTRSEKNPKLGQVTYSFEKEALGSMVFHAFKVETNIKSPEKVDLKMDILDSEGVKIGDAFKLLDYGIQVWERLVDEAGENA